MQGLNRHEALKHNADEGDDRDDEENQYESYDFISQMWSIYATGDGDD